MLPSLARAAIRAHAMYIDAGDDADKFIDAAEMCFAIDRHRHCCFCIIMTAVPWRTRLGAENYFHYYIIYYRDARRNFAGDDYADR